MKYKARVRFMIKHKNVNPMYRDNMQGAMGFQVILNMAMRRYMPSSIDVTWAVISQWVTEL